MKKNTPHEADLASAAHIAHATHFNAFVRVAGVAQNRKADTLAQAIEAADALEAEFAGKRALIYAITPEDYTVHVDKAAIAAERARLAP